MIRFFTSYPEGLPGLGLLLLRLTTICTGLFVGRMLTPMLSAAPLALLTDVSGLIALTSVVLGLLAPLGCAVLLIELFSVLTLSPALRACSGESTIVLLNLCAMLVTIASSGPGAFSLDARLFGRREIIIPG